MRSAARLSVLSGILAVLCIRPAFGQVRTCSPMSIEVAPAVSARWPELPDSLRETFEGRDGIDRCARVRVSVRDGSITVEVALPDGRFTTRSVSRREDVVPTLEALLLVPQHGAQVETSALETSLPHSTNPFPPPEPASSLGTSDVVFNGGLVAPERDTLAPSSGRRPSRVRIELSAVTGARVGDGQASVGAGVLSFLDLSGWLIGFQGRADRYQAVGSGDWSGWALELAVLGGRRFQFHGVGLDLDVGPALIPQGTTMYATQSPNATASSSSTVPRLLLGGRVSFSPRSIVHTFVGIDGEVGPSRLGDDLPHAPQLPIWTVGLALGATVGTQ